MSRPNHWYLLAKKTPKEKWGFTVDFECIMKFTGGRRYFKNLNEARKARALFKRKGLERVILKRTCQALER